MRFGICALARSRHVGGCALIWTRGRARVACACPSVRVRCARRPSAQLVAAVYIYLKRRHFNSTTTATSRQSYMELGVPGARSFERCDTVSPCGTVVPPELGVPGGRSSRDLLVPPTTPQRSCLVSDASAQHGCCFRRHVRRSMPRRAVLVVPANETAFQVRRRGHRQPGVADG